MKPLLVLFLLSLCTHLPAQTVELIQMPLEDLRAKAAAGDPPAMIQLALRYYNGIGVIQYEKKGYDLYMKAADCGSKTALGVCAANGWGRPKDPKLAFATMEKASATGDLTAIRNLGRFYAEGIGCKVDKAKALELYQQAFVPDDPLSACVLAKAWFAGYGTKEDVLRGFKLVEQNAEHCTFAKVTLADCYQLARGWVATRMRPGPSNSMPRPPRRETRWPCASSVGDT